MATISPVISSTVQGNLRVRVADWTCSSTAEAVDMGMGNIIAALLTLKSGTSMTSQPRMLENKGASGTSIVGTLALTSTVSGDVYRIVVYAHA